MQAEDWRHLDWKVHPGCGASNTIRLKKLSNHSRLKRINVDVYVVYPKLDFELAVTHLSVTGDTTTKMDVHIELDAGPVFLRQVTCQLVKRHTGTAMIG